MGRLGGRRLKRTGLIAALAILPVTPLVTSVVSRLVFGPGVPGDGPFVTYLNLHTVLWTVMLVAIAVALVPTGLTLMRRPDASGPWALGVFTIALGVVGTAYAAARLALEMPDVSLGSVLLLVALTTVPAAAGVLLLRHQGLSGAQPLGLLAIALGAIGVMYSVPWLSFLVTSGVKPSGTFVASAFQITALSIAPLALGTLFIRRKGMSVVQALGIIAVLLGIIGSIDRGMTLSFYLMDFDQWRATAVVEFAMVSVVALASASVGILMIPNKYMPVVSALGVVTIALGIIGMAYGVSALISNLLFAPGALYSYSIVLSILLFVPLIVGLGVVPVSAGVVLSRRSHVSGVWALGVTATVLGVVGTTFSAVQLLASGGPTLFMSFVGLTLINTAWLP